MSRVLELEEQIKRLQEEKSKIYSEERKAALVGIKEKIALFEFTAKELGIKLPKATAADMLEKKAKSPAKKAAKKAGGKRTFKSSGMYFDLDGKHIPAGRGRPPKEVSVFAAEKGVTPDSLKRNADGTPVGE